DECADGAGGRAQLDACWTPDAGAAACARFLDLRGLEGLRILEPAVGGGAWVRAARTVWPDSAVTGIDIDPEAPGLPGAHKAEVGDFLTHTDETYDLVLGNPPYASDLLLPWLDHSLKLAPVVAYLLRETITGTQTRLSWWLAHRPAFVVKICPRPKWEGPGARDTADRADTILVVWVRGQDVITEWDWIDTEADHG
ncbi:MAG: hypothetical protein AAF211_19785, partial [Myxococcota bacterium]